MVGPSPTVGPNPKEGPSPKVAMKETWCVANGEVGEGKLQGALDYACGEGGADCHPIQEGATCYDPNTLEAHASYAFNSFYQKNKRAMGSCDFEGAAYVTSRPPSTFTLQHPFFFWFCFHYCLQLLFLICHLIVVFRWLHLLIV